MRFDITKVDYRDLSEKAMKFCEGCDQEALKNYFGTCKNLEEMNKIAEALADALGEPEFYDIAEFSKVEQELCSLKNVGKKVVFKTVRNKFVVGKVYSNCITLGTMTTEYNTPEEAFERGQVVEPNNQTRSATIHFRCTPHEKEEIERMAKESHKSISAFILDAVFC